MVAFSGSMGKIKRQKISKIKLGKPKRNVPLADQIDGDKYETQSLRRKERKRQEEDEVIDDRMSVKILREAKKQQEEIEEEEGLRSSSRTTPKTVKLGESDESEEEYDLDENEDIDYQHMEVAPEDEKAFELFMSDKPSTRRTIADMIQEKITEKQTELKSQLSDQSCHVQELDERVVSMYKQVKEILMHYRGGKLPKAFKIIPSLQNWEQILFLTEPDRWSAAAVYQATKIFASNLNQKKAQRFYNVVLFPRLRDDIAEYKRLNYHLYLALGKALFKSAAFFKGILLPLCEGGDCTLLEAVVLSSVVAKHSIPMLHSAAAMLKIAEMPYSGASSIFLRVLIDKKYALPFRVVDAVVHHFLKFQSEKRHLPVLWHQCLLTFAQRYKEDLSSEQKESLLELIKAKSHHLISAEIRRELSQSKCRDEESELYAEQSLQQGEMCWE